MESWETGDSREEEDTQWRQALTLYTRILRTFADSAYFVYYNIVYILYMGLRFCRFSFYRYYFNFKITICFEN